MITSNISIVGSGVTSAITYTDSGSIVNEVLPSSGVVSNDISTPSVAGIAIINTGSGIIGPKGDVGGTSFIKVASENIGGQRIVVLNADDEVEYASSENMTHMNIVLGLTKTAIVQGGEVEVLNNIIFEEPSWNWTPNLPVFLTANGLMSQNINDTGLFILSIGTALSATKIYLKQSQPIGK